MKKFSNLFNLKTLLIFQLLLLSSSCATIVASRDQSVNISSSSANKAPLNNSICKLVNSKGEWSTQTPKSVSIRKSYGDLVINCTNRNLRGSQTFKSSHDSIIWGNVLFGGLIGWAVDVGTGSGFSYPENMNVEMN
ncbi:MAG: hypothetical protein ACO26G_03300 [Rickettsiales bacterium]